jgi:hypothetical protein
VTVSASTVLANTVPASAPSPVVAALKRFRPVPHGLAVYDIGVEDAAWALRMNASAVLDLAECGLPHVVDPERGPLFDYDDIMNVGRFSGTGETGPELALRFLMRFVAMPSASWYQPRGWLVTVGAAADPAAGKRITAGLGLRRPDYAAPGVRVLPSHEPDAGYRRPDDEELQTAAYQVAVRLTGAAHVIADPAVRPIWDGVVEPLVAGEVGFQAVAEPLRRDHHRAWELGIADCIVASKVLADRLKAAGLQARVRRGYQLGLYGSDHAWCELFEDGEYKPMDPLFSYLGRVGAPELGLPPSAQFAEAAYGGRFNRLLPFVAEDAEPLIYLDGRPAPYWALAGVGAKPHSL